MGFLFRCSRCQGRTCRYCFWTFWNICDKCRDKDDTKQGEDREDIKRGKGYRQGKAYWGLDKIFGQATKTKDHFSKEIAGLGGLVNRVGDLFGASDDYDEDEVIFSIIKNATNTFLSKSYRKGEKSGHCGF